MYIRGFPRRRRAEFRRPTNVIRPTALFVLDPAAADDVYPPAVRATVASLADVLAPPMSAAEARERPDLLVRAEVLMSGWFGPRLDAAFLDAAPQLRTVFYAAGSTNLLMTDEAYRRGIRVTSAYAANAAPVAEYTLSTVLFSLKHGWAAARATRERRAFAPPATVPGAYGSTVGLVSLGMTGRAVASLLQPFDVIVVAHDPLTTAGDASSLGVELVSLDDVFARGDVVSIHAPLLDETVGLIRGRHVAAMRPGATLINTARGAIVNEPELTDVLARRPDLHAVLDVTFPEPPVASSPLYTLPNVTLTPHIAGSLGAECGRMGRAMADELRRYVSGRPLKWEVTPALAAHSSHRPGRVLVAQPA
jgi:phosphoglycerate dehydrogenase-like enzyme